MGLMGLFYIHFSGIKVKHLQTHFYRTYLCLLHPHNIIQSFHWIHFGFQNNEPFVYFVWLLFCSRYCFSLPKKISLFCRNSDSKGKCRKKNILCSNFIVTVVFIALDGDALYSYVEKSYFYAAIM